MDFQLNEEQKMLVELADRMGALTSRWGDCHLPGGDTPGHGDRMTPSEQYLSISEEAGR